MKVEAVACDSVDCDVIAVSDGADIPYDWMALEIYQEGSGVIETKTFCSWDCLHRHVKYHERSTVPVRRRRKPSEPEPETPVPTPVTT